MYAKTKRLNLSNVSKNRCVYDFLNSLRTVNADFVIDRKTILIHEINQSKLSTSIRNILKEFRNHLRIARALITRRATHETFVTLQKKNSENENNDKSDQSKKSDKNQSSNRKIEKFLGCS